MATPLRALLVITSLVTACAAVALLAQPNAQPTVTAFVGVAVIPMDKEAVVQNQTVVVRDGKIASIAPAGSAQVPADAVRVDGKGKFLMPALAEMHAHIPGGKAPDSAIERTLFLYVASGVTTIRGMLGDPRHLTYRASVVNGAVLGPRIYTSGPSFNGKTAPTKDVAVEAVIAQKKMGYDLLKIHPGVPRDGVRRDGGKGPRAQDSVCRARPRGRRSASRARGAVPEHRPPRRLRRGAGERQSGVAVLRREPDGAGRRDRDSRAGQGDAGCRRLAGPDPGAARQPAQRRDGRRAGGASGDEVRAAGDRHRELDQAAAEFPEDSARGAEETAVDPASADQGHARRGRAVRARLRRAADVERAGLLRSTASCSP